MSRRQAKPSYPKVTMGIRVSQLVKEVLLTKVKYLFSCASLIERQLGVIPMNSFPGQKKPLICRFTGLGEQLLLFTVP